MTLRTDVAFGYGRVDAFRALVSISRGDCNQDGYMDLQDVLMIGHHITTSEDMFPSTLLGDCNCDGIVDMTDALYLADAAFMGGPPVVNPCFEFGD